MKARLAAMEAEAAKLREVCSHSHQPECPRHCSWRRLPCSAKQPLNKTYMRHQQRMREVTG